MEKLDIWPHLHVKFYNTVLFKFQPVIKISTDGLIGYRLILLALLERIHSLFIVLFEISNNFLIPLAILDRVLI